MFTTRETHPALTVHYGTEKLADLPSQLARAAYGVSLAERAHQMGEERDVRHERRVHDQEVARALQIIRLMEANGRLHHSHVPIILADGGGAIPGGAIPLGMDEGMVRIAQAIGADMAKEAGFVSAIGQAAKGAFGAAGLGNAAAKATGQGAFGRMVSGLKSGFQSGMKTPGIFAGKLEQAAHAAGVEMPKSPGLLDRAKAALTPGGRLESRMNAAVAAPPAAAPTPVAGRTANTRFQNAANEMGYGTKPPSPGASQVPAAPSQTPPTPQASSSQAYRQPAPQAAPPPEPGPAASAPAAQAAAPGAAAEAAKPTGTFGRLKQEYEKGNLLKGVRNLALVGGAGYLGYKTLNHAMDVMGREPQGPAVYGAGGPQVAQGLNQYGQPQLY